MSYGEISNVQRKLMSQRAEIKRLKDKVKRLEGKLLETLELNTMLQMQLEDALNGGDDG